MVFSIYYLILTLNAMEFIFQLVSCWLLWSLRQLSLKVWDCSRFLISRLHVPQIINSFPYIWLSSIVQVLIVNVKEHLAVKSMQENAIVSIFPHENVRGQGIIQIFPGFWHELLIFLKYNTRHLTCTQNPNSIKTLLGFDHQVLLISEILIKPLSLHFWTGSVVWCLETR